MDRGGLRRRFANSKRRETLCVLLILTITFSFSSAYFYHYYFVVGSNYITTPQIGFYTNGNKVLYVGFDRNLTGIEASVNLKNMSGDTVFSGAIEYVGFTMGKYIFLFNFETFIPSSSNDYYDVYINFKNTPFGRINISDNPFKETEASLFLNFFQEQRCGFASSKQLACHAEDIFLIEDKEYNLTGGWHDAGDYNKYSVNTAYTLYLLLDLYARIDGMVELKEKLKEEILFGLDWLLRMQDDDGGVFEKVSGGFSGNSDPSLDQTQRSLYTKKYTGNSAYFAATVAKASKILGSLLFGLNLTEKAELAFKFSIDNPNYFPEWAYGVYPGDGFSIGWASSELYSTTGKIEYLDIALKYSNFTENSPTNYISGWNNVNLHSAFTLFGRKNSTLDDQITTYLTRNFNSIKNLNDFGIINDQTTWGINAKVLHHAMDSVKLYEITMNRTYLDRAIHHMYWVLGNNPFEKCFIVGIGQDSYAIEKMYGLQERNINGGVVPGPIVNEDGDLVYHDCNSKKKSCWVYDEATIDATAIGMWMFTEMMNATRYNSLL